MEVFLTSAAAAVNQGFRELMDSVLEVVMSLNKKKLVQQKEETTLMCNALREIMADEIKEALENSEKKGNINGEERMGKLMFLLYNSDRASDAQRAVSDSDYRRQLFAEFQL